MDSIQELPSIGVKELAKPVVKPQPELQTGQKTGLALKLAETKASARVHAEKATRLISVVSMETDDQRLQGTVTTEDARGQLEALAKGEPIAPSEYIGESKKALQISARVKHEASVQQDSLQKQIDTRDRKIRWEINDRISELGQMQGIKKFPAALEKGSLGIRKSVLQRQIDQLRPQLEGKRQLIDLIAEQEKPVRAKQEDAILTEIGQEIKAIRTEYEQLLQEILTDGTLTSEIRENYIQQIIAPQVDWVIKDDNLPARKKDEFYSILRTYLDHREEPEEQSKPYKEKLDQFLYHTTGFYHGIREDCGRLENGADKAIVGKLLAQIAAEDIVPIKTAVSPYLYSWEARDNFDHLFDNAVNPSRGMHGDENLFGRQILSVINKGDQDFPNMEFWTAVKSTTAAKEIFGEVIQKQDERYYAAILDKSLSDTQGGDIDMLVYYPTPDAIRTLVILASADYENYRTVHANWSLDSLSKLPNWKHILDEAEATYPALKPARKVLEKWNFSKNVTEYTNNPEIQQVVEELASSIYEDKTVDKRLAELALISLPNQKILDVLAERSVIPSAVANRLKDVEDLYDTSYQAWMEQIKRKDYTGSYISGYSFQSILRGNIQTLLRSKPDELPQTPMEVLTKMDIVAHKILENRHDEKVVNYLSNQYVLNKIIEPSMQTEDIALLLDAYKTAPALYDSNQFLQEFCRQFDGEQSIQFFKNISTAYAKHSDRLISIVQLVGNEKLSRERALELPLKADDILSGDLSSLPIEFPKVYLATDQDCEFFRKMLTSYDRDAKKITEVSQFLDKEQIGRELALAFPQQAPTLMDDKMRETRWFIYTNGNSLLKDISDIKFLNGLAGEFGTKSDQLIRGYQECLAANVLSTQDKELIPEFARQFRIISPTTLQGYKEAKEAGHEKVYVAQLQALAERMTGSGAITDEERAKPYYKDLLQHVYSNNSGNWTSFKSNESCPDRSSDLTQFKIKPRYEMDLLSQSEIRVKEGETLDAVVKADVQKPILDVAEQMNALGHDKAKIEAALQERVDKTLQEIVEKGGLPDVNLETATTLDEKMFLVLTDSLYGTRSIDAASVKNLVINYEFTTFEDVSDYIAGTSDRVARANNQDYALFCEVGTFYSDRIKEVNRRLVQAAWNNPTIAAVMPKYFTKLAQETTMVQRKDMINRLQIDKLGASEGFIKQAGRILENRRGKKYTPEEVQTLIQRYESFTGGLTEKASTSPKPETKAFYGQLRSQRERTFEALKAITGQEVDPKQAHLGEINLQQVLDTEASIREGKYDEEQFASYTVQRFIDLFEDERTKIDRELAKFESLSGKQREVLYGYVTKSKESAHARMVGGVCVSGDNPDKYPNQNMWSMPNYLQMVFQEPDTVQCQGLVLLHHFNEQGKKILTASFNPSSTYLYSVDETALFNGIAGSLEQFATENGFDIIAVPQNHTIRTNRTGGEFEKAIDKRVAQVRKTFKFNAAQQFSYHPNYQIQDMDIIWEKPKA